ncbi:MAG: hypothetical protein J6V90_06430 [Treponema sp.]|nr:hypothetical protein [Treponema sp.]
MINTLNESQLHKALKTFYAVQFSAQEEVQVERWICDLVCPDGGIVEIQTKNVGALKEKIQGLLKIGRRVTIVHPIIKEKIIESRLPGGGLVSRRKSPKKESLYSELREFTGLKEFLLDKKLSVICPEISIEEKRIVLDQAQQSKNGRRRFKKAWQKEGKALLTIGTSWKLCGKKDWLGLLPKEMLQAKKNRGKAAEPFSAATVREMFLKNKETKAAAPYANILLWLLRETGLIVRVPHSGRGYHYLLK